MSRLPRTRTELLQGRLALGGKPLDLADYATTGLRMGVVAPSGAGKTNVGCLVAEQLSEQGWVSVLIDAEGELESLYGNAVTGPEDLRERLIRRDRPIVVVSVADAREFLAYGRVLLEVADQRRDPILLVLDESQLFSSARSRRGEIGEATDLINDIFQRGRKRSLDVVVTAHRYTGSLHRSIFGNLGITLIGAQSDPTVWAALAPRFRGTKIEFGALASLAPGQFFMFSQRGVEKVTTPMATALARVAKKATVVARTLPSTFAEWDRAVAAIPTPRLAALTPAVVTLLCTVSGLSAHQVLSGKRALEDELQVRA